MTDERTDEKPEWDWAEKRMSDGSLRQFVLDYCAGRVFTSRDLHQPKDAPMVFLLFIHPDAQAILKQAEDQLGLIWAHMSEALPRAINGMPQFLGCHLMHKDDWARAQAAIEREVKRREGIEV